MAVEDILHTSSTEEFLTKGKSDPSKSENYKVIEELIDTVLDNHFERANQILIHFCLFVAEVLSKTGQVEALQILHNAGFESRLKKDIETVLSSEREIIALSTSTTTRLALDWASSPDTDLQQILDDIESLDGAFVHELEGQLKTKSRIYLAKELTSVLMSKAE